MGSRPTNEAQLRTALRRKGMAINQQLTALLAGKNPTMVDVKMPHEQKPGLKPEEKLRIFLDVVVRAQRRVGTDAWGLCVECGAELPELGLVDMPWLELCDGCGAPHDEP